MMSLLHDPDVSKPLAQRRVRPEHQRAGPPTTNLADSESWEAVVPRRGKDPGSLMKSRSVANITGRKFEDGLSRLEIAIEL